MSGIDIEAVRLVRELEDLGVYLWEEAGALRFRAPQGVLTEQRRQTLKQHKQDVLALLNRKNSKDTVLVPDPAARYEPFPLTDVQSAYLLGRRNVFAYGGVSCHVYGELAFEKLDAQRLETAWCRLMDQHEMLRAVVHPDGYQQVLAEVPDYHIKVLDLRGQGEEAMQAALDAARGEMSYRGYELGEWPMFELRVTHMDTHSLLHLSVDFLIADYLSIQKLLAGLGELYNDQEAVLPELEVSFRDYVLAERKLHEGPEYERDRAYWIDRLEDLPIAPELPHAPGAAESQGDANTQFVRLQMWLPGQKWKTLREHAALHHLTPSGAVLAAYAAVVARWSRQPRFTLNLTLLNRQPLHHQVQDLIGDFTTVSLLEVDWSQTERTFAERAAVLQQQLWQDMDHRLFSGIEVMRELGRRKGRAAALMPVVFTSTIGMEEGTTSDASGSQRGWGEFVHGVSQTPQVWIDCQAVERDGGLAVVWDVRQSVFPKGLPEAMFEALSCLLAEMAEGEAAWSRSTVPHLPEAQKRLRHKVNDTAGSLPDALLHEGFLRSALVTPDRVAVTGPATKTPWTYRELAKYALAVSAELSARGCRPGEVVAVVAEKGPEQIAAVLGTLLAGGAYLPIDTTQPPVRRDAILADASVRHVVTGDPLDGSDWPHGVDSFAIRDLEPASDLLSRLPERLVDPNDLAYVIYTSGSTGKPKGVMISHRAAVNTITDINERFGLGQDDVVLGLAGLGFDLSVQDIFGTFAIGGTLVLPMAELRGDPSHWVQAIVDHGVTLWNSVPAQLQMLMHYVESDPSVQLRSLRLGLLSGDWIPIDLPALVQARLPQLRLISLGGATEAAIWSIHHPIDLPSQEPTHGASSIPYGLPLRNQTFHVLDQLGQDCPDWVPGELHIGGEGLALGYLGDPQRTAERFIAHPADGRRIYRTGDFGRYLPNGEIEFLGRADSQVKIRGHRIELSEIDAALQSNPLVAASAVLVTGDNTFDRRLVGFIQPARRSAAAEAGKGLRERMIQAAREVAAPELAADEPARGVEFVQRLNRVALLSMLRQLRACGLFASQDDSHTTEQIVRQACVATSHVALVRRWLLALVEADMLAYDDTVNTYRLVASWSETAVEDAWRDLEHLRIVAGYSDRVPEYLRRSTAHLGKLLRGEENALGLLFPEGSTETVQSAYDEYLVGRNANALVAGLVTNAAHDRESQGVLRVLEVGAGAGGTSASLVQALDIHRMNIDYLFTDVSPFFLNKARERFADRPWVRYALYDLNEDPLVQGLPSNGFDIVVAGNVLHYARHAGQALNRLRELLRPGGWLVFIEAGRDNPWVMASMEFLEGADDFEDLRWGRDQRFFTRAQWLDLLAEAGAHPVICLPEEDEPLAGAGQYVFAARFKPDLVPVEPALVEKYLEERLPEYMVPRHWQVLDRIPLNANGKVDRARLTSWLPDRKSSESAVGDSPQGDLENRVAALWAEILRLPKVGRNRDFFDLGGDSLLASQLAGRLRERLPEAEDRYFDELLRQFLQDPTVAGLAQFLSQTAPRSGDGQTDASAKVPSPLVPLGGGGEGPLHVLVHDAGGTMSPYIALAQELAKQGPVVGLAITKVDAYLQQSAQGLLANLADQYTRLLVETRYEAFHLVGRDLGGTLAVEVARRLMEEGHEMIWTTIIGYCPTPCLVEDDLLVEYAFAVSKGLDTKSLGYPAELADLYHACARTEHRRLSGRWWTGLAPEAGLAHALEAFLRLTETGPAERLRALGQALADHREDVDAEAFAKAHLEVFRHSLAALSAHRHEPFAGDLLHIRTTDGDVPWHEGGPAGPWEDLCLGELKTIMTSLTHAQCLRQPYAAEIAAMLKPHLGASARGTSGGAA